MDTSTYPDPNQIIPRTAAMALAEGEIVTYGSLDTTCTRAGATPATLMGVNKYTTPSGASADIAQGGVERVKTGAAITRGDWLTSDSTGRAIPLTLAAAGATYVACLGQAMESTGGADQYVAVKLNIHPVIIA